jgi:hypothetical protein
MRIKIEVEADLPDLDGTVVTRDELQEWLEMELGVKGWASDISEDNPLFLQNLSCDATTLWWQEVPDAP